MSINFYRGSTTCRKLQVPLCLTCMALLTPLPVLPSPLFSMSAACFSAFLIIASSLSYSQGGGGRGMGQGDVKGTGQGEGRRA